MWLFLIKTIVTAVMFYLVFCFYGNINDGLFIKGFFCVIFMLFVYWVDIYRLTKIFSCYFLAKRNFSKARYERAFVYFQHLLDYSFAPSLPYLAIMRFKGLGCEANAETAKYYSERAMRNGYYDCLYLVAVIDFFGDALPDNKKLTCKQRFRNEQNGRLDYTQKSPRNQSSVHNSKLEPDYASCVYHLNQYIEEVSNGKNTDGHYLAEAYALLAYCTGAGLGTNKDTEHAAALFSYAATYHSKNAEELKSSLVEHRQPASFKLDIENSKKVSTS